MIKIKKQLWYLGGQLSILVIFDDRVSYQEKLKISRNIKISKGSNSKANKKAVYKNQRTISDFVDISSLQIFKIFQLDYSFFELDPKLWTDNLSYQSCLQKLGSLHPVNDAAESAIGLITRVKNSSKKYISPDIVEKQVFNIERDLKINF